MQVNLMFQKQLLVRCLAADEILSARTEQSGPKTLTLFHLSLNYIHSINTLFIRANSTALQTSSFRLKLNQHLSNLLEQKLNTNTFTIKGQMAASALTKCV